MRAGGLLRVEQIMGTAIGIDVRTHRWIAFVVAGAAAGLAGGLFAFSKGSIDPTLISISTSIWRRANPAPSAAGSSCRSAAMPDCVSPSGSLRWLPSVDSIQRGARAAA